jgi:hypothetical protein
MPKQKHDPEASPAFVIRYLNEDPEQNEIVKRVNGQKEAIKWLNKLSKEEEQPKKYSYLWRWKDPRAALEYDMKQLDRERSA